jgi:hypothetical protein
MLTNEGCYAFRDDVVSTVLDDGAILLDLETKFFYELDATGWALAAMFENGASIQSVLERSREWGAPSGDEPAIRAVIDTLVAEKLIVPGSEAAVAPEVDAPAAWTSPSIIKQEQPLQQIMMSAFDPSVPLLE